MEDNKNNTEENLITNGLNEQKDVNTDENKGNLDNNKENSAFKDLINSSTERLRDNAEENTTNNNEKDEKNMEDNSEEHKEDEDKVFSDEEKTNDEADKKNKKQKKKWTKKKKIIVVASIVLGIFLILGIVFGTYIYRANGNIAEAVINAATDILGNDEPIFVLVLGVSEDINVELTDTIILAGYNPKTQKAFMLSIPRDTFVGKSESSANGYDKINALYQKDVEKTVEAVEGLTGIKIDNYIIVKNTALPAIVDAIGEVEFDVPIDMDYDDPTQNLHIHLEAGMQKINGEKAEQLLRFRHNNDGSSYPTSYGDNDYGRMRTQREFIKVVASQLVSFGNASKLKEIATAVFDNLVTDMSLGKAIGYIPYALKFDTNSIIMEQLPGSSAMINELWFYKASSSQTKELMGELITELGLTDKEIESHYKYTVKKSDKSSKKNNNNDISEEDTSTNSKKTANTTSSNTSDNKKEVPKTESSNKDFEKNNTDNNTDNNKQNTSTTKPAHQHNYTSSVTTPATCTSAGVRTYKCTGCSSSYTESIGVKAHNYSNGVCTSCGAKDPKYVVPETPTNPSEPQKPSGEGENKTPEEKPNPEPETPKTDAETEVKTQ